MSYPRAIARHRLLQRDCAEQHSARQCRGRGTGLAVQGPIRPDRGRRCPRSSPEPSASDPERTCRLSPKDYGEHYPNLLKVIRNSRLSYARYRFRVGRLTRAVNHMISMR